MRNSKGRNQTFALMRKLQFGGIFLCLIISLAALSGLQANAASPQSNDVQAKVIDPITTDSITLRATQAQVEAKAALHNASNGISVPDTVSVLADRRLLAMMALVGVFLVWINRAPGQNKN